jgi:capsule polysaccharide modification protein KpsS
VENLQSTHSEVEYLFISDNFTTDKYLETCGINRRCILLEKPTKNENENSEFFFQKYKNSLCGVTGKINQHRAKKLYNKTLTFLNKKNKFDVLWCWNGNKFLDKILIEHFNKLNLSVKCFEVANLSGKFIVDDNGTNASSRLMSEITKIHHPIIAPSHVFARWKENFIQEKEKNPIIPQSTVPLHEYTQKILNLLNLKNSTLRYHCDSLDRFAGYLLKKTFIYLFNQKNIRHYDIYFPQQVINDSQLIFNSKTTNLDAIKIIASKNPSQKIVTNIHPAEHHLSHLIKTIYLAKRTKNLYLSHQNSWELIKRSSSITSINSTVGLEAALNGKGVNFIGKTYFSEIVKNEEMINFYTQTYSVSMLDLKENSKLSNELLFFLPRIYEKNN